MITKCSYSLLKFIQPAFSKLDKFYINIYTFLYIMITKCPHTSYDESQWFLEFS